MRKLLRFLKYALFVALVPFGAAMLAIPLYIHQKVSKVDPVWHPSLYVLYWARFWTWVLQVSFDFALAILYNEGASVARQLSDTELAALRIVDAKSGIGYPVGDIADPRGPAIGPGQVLWTEIEDIWDNTPAAWRFTISKESPAEIALQGNEFQAMFVAVKAMQEVLHDAQGDFQLAAQYYNGGEVHRDPRALAYAQRATDTMARLKT